MHPVPTQEASSPPRPATREGATKAVQLSPPAASIHLSEEEGLPSQGTQITLLHIEAHVPERRCRKEPVISSKRFSKRFDARVETRLDRNVSSSSIPLHRLGFRLPVFLKRHGMDCARLHFEIGAFELEQVHDLRAKAGQVEETRGGERDDELGCLGFVFESPNIYIGWLSVRVVHGSQHSKGIA